MRGTFGERTELLGEMVGERDLVISVSFSGPHAAAHHEHPSRFSPPSWAGHPVLTYTTPGTGVKYLTGPQMESYPLWLQRLADKLLDEPRGLRGEAEDVAEDWAQAAARRAPKESGDLVRSATPRVTDDGRVVYQRIG